MNTRTLLLVEDESITALVEKHILKNAGFSVIVSPSGENAIKIMESGEKVDLILMDIDLGKGMDGTQTAQIILKNHNVPIVFLSSHTEKEIVDKTRSITRYGYIPKNSGEAVLLASIDMALELFGSYEKLNKNESRFRTSIENLLDCFMICSAIRDTEGRITDFLIEEVNSSACKYHEMSKHEQIGKKLCELLPFHRESGLFEAYCRVLETGIPIEKEILHPAAPQDEKDVRSMEIKVTRFGDGFTAAWRDTTRHRELDIKELVEAQRRQALYIKLLGNLIRSKDVEEIVRFFLSIIKEYSNFEAVGLRLKSGDDYPYYQTYGFSDEFVKLERNLCSYDSNNEIIREASGNPVLECMCGNVIYGRTNPDLPFFTKGGSFWTNCTTQLLASTSEVDRMARTRNRCNGEGYESVALFPLRTLDKNIGLLQLNDRRKGQFTLEIIEFFESVATSIGIAIERVLMEERLKSELSEKDLIIREIYHREKNNLQIISGILSLESAMLTGEKEKNIFKDVIGRIYSMTLVFDKLYKTGTSEILNLNPYINDLINSIIQSYVTQAESIEIAPNIQDIVFPTKKAITTGLIVNELITNSIKHAFPNQSKGTVYIEMVQENKYVKLFISDNGVGIPDEVFNNSTEEAFGLKLVEILVTQLNGKYELNRENGTHYTIWLPTE